MFVRWPVDVVLIHTILRQMSEITEHRSEPITAIKSVQCLLQRARTVVDLACVVILLGSRTYFHLGVTAAAVVDTLSINSPPGTSIMYILCAELAALRLLIYFYLPPAAYRSSVDSSNYIYWRCRTLANTFSGRLRLKLICVCELICLTVIIEDEEWTRSSPRSRCLSLPLPVSGTAELPNRKYLWLIFGTSHRSTSGLMDY